MSSTSEIQTQVLKWLQAYHASGDSMNPHTSVPEFYTEDCEMIFPGKEPIKGHAQIIAFFGQQFQTLASMKHTIGHVDVVEDRIYQEANIEYVLKGDPEEKVIKVQGLAVFGKGVRDERMKFFKVFLDPSPIFKRVGELQQGSA
ncbi:nuclear transport factor 2 family protein [Aspergillus affinis]|uniref:nuclear transport factor 2 family protein n=1 Tax=Aspergillus affinis TaxID=1070780 RepID=UPI0022FEDE4E|nr:NTF2-like protein [Aspergillus affinis]KAI9038830.1 NTF2-like protein [Aspergillus affinis]